MIPIDVKVLFIGGMMTCIVPGCSKTPPPGPDCTVNIYDQTGRPRCSNPFFREPDCNAISSTEATSFELVVLHNGQYFCAKRYRFNEQKG